MTLRMTVLTWVIEGPNLSIFLASDMLPESESALLIFPII